MSIVRNIEVIAQSPNGFDDACREAIREGDCREIGGQAAVATGGGASLAA